MSLPSTSSPHLIPILSPGHSFVTTDDIVQAHNNDPTFQTIGFKGLKRGFAERGLRIGKTQGEIVAELEKCDDSSPKKKHEKAYAAELFTDRGHYCVFGVKCNAELAHIERVWMWLKSKIRGHLTGKLAKLQSEIWKAYSLYTVLDARKAARHCRETMEAYLRVADSNEIGLSELAAEEVNVYTTHRRVFDANTATLKEVADMPVSDKEKKQAAVLAKKKQNARQTHTGGMGARNLKTGE